jgi:DNA-binding LacI/PurR family transcriptional regulator
VKNADTKVHGDPPKYQRILTELRHSISVGQVKPGDRLPSENELGGRFSVSRLTVQRALKELQIEGLVDRRAGSGTYVLPRKESSGKLFGLLIPGLGETEIFEPICQGMAKAGRNGGHALLWGHTIHAGDEDKEFLAQQLCADYIARRVSGVFFAPMEGCPNKDAFNLSIVDRLSAAGIAVVLLDRCIFKWPNRSRFDLVGIDNRRGGNQVARHLLNHGVKRPVFLARPNSAPTVDQRFAGFAEALRAQGLDPGEMIRADPANQAAVRQILDSRRPDAFVCANDRTAATLMQTLETLGLEVPKDIRITGFDDVRYSNLLRVPLTSLRQPCNEIGETAILAMLSRLDQPNLPARDILLDCKLVVRKSCGSDIVVNTDLTM